MRTTQLLRRFGMDILVWICAPSIFLFTYVHEQLVPRSAILPHLRLVFLALLLLVLIRIALSRLVTSDPWSRFAASIVASIMLAAMILYYILVIIGIQAWGRVISWELIASYAVQAPDLAKTLEISLPLVIGVFGICYLALLAATWAYIRRYDWSLLFRQRVSALLQVGLFFVGCAIATTETVRFVTFSDARKSEPVGLTFFPAEAILAFQDSAIDRMSADNIDRKENVARSTYTVNPEADRKNVILIVVDALRSDHMGLYGYERNTTPYLGQLTQTVRVQRPFTMHASCGESACGLYSLSSSKFVYQFSAHPFTLQQVLKRHGYKIHMILGGDHVHFYGLREIYGKVDSFFDGSMALGRYANDDQVVIDKIASFPSWDKVPVMFQFHLMSTHILGKRAENSVRYVPAANYARLKNRDADNTGNSNQRAVNYYDNGVLQTDAVIKTILMTLRDKGYLKNSIVVITADHGESLGEHGLFLHGNSVREEVLRIPFVMIPYGYQSRPFSEEHAFASQVDIAPTLLRELGMRVPETWSGMPLQDSGIKGFSYFQQGADIGLIDHRDPRHVWKYWLNQESGDEYAFDLSIDSREANNSIKVVPSITKGEWRLQLLTPLHGGGV